MANEKRLIDAYELEEEIERIYEEHYKDSCYQFIHDLFRAMLRRIRNAETVDAVEVVHGRWKEMHYEGGILDGTNFDRCSVCGYERVFNDPALKTVFKYCPNCGAKMDGGGDDDQA